MPRNLGWYNRNCTRPYPLDDQATRLDDDGNLLQHHLIVDMQLLIPESAGTYIHVGGISVGSQLATITFVASQGIDDVTNMVPVAAVSTLTPEKYVHYAVQPLYPGVGGWVVWGTGVEQSNLVVHRFSRPRQSLILPRAAKWYRDFPIPSVGRMFGTALTGLIKLSGGSHIEIVKENREIAGGLSRDAIVMRLKATQSKLDADLPAYIAPGTTAAAQASDQTVPTTDRALYRLFRGPCGDRPESHTCGNPEPIETINDVPPDCCGNITIRFLGCARLSGVEQEVVLDDGDEEILVDEACGVVVDCGLDIDDACPESALPTLEGIRRWQFDTLCVSESLSTFSIQPAGDSVPNEDTGSTAYEDCIPFYEEFFNPIDSDWEVVQGFFGSKTYTFDEVEPAYLNGWYPRPDFGPRQAWGSYPENSWAVRNIMIWKGCPGAWWRRVSVCLTPIFEGPTTRYPNPGVIFNYRETSPGSGIYEWWALQVTTYRWQIIHFDGRAEHILKEGYSEALQYNWDWHLGLDIVPWYVRDIATGEVEPGVWPDGNPTGAQIRFYVVDQDDYPGVTWSEPIYLNNFGPATGYFGITGDCCHVAATQFSVNYSNTNMMGV